ncbi:MAG: hypothetical protein ACFBSE_11215 [Prochloraceae cyanobacterium]
MFGRKSEPSRPPRPVRQANVEVETIPDVTVTPETSSRNAEENIFVNDRDLNDSELVRKAESINSVVAPYFIVVVGLLLMDKIFFLGLLLLVVGMFSLLRISIQDIIIWVDNIKKSL